MKRSVRVPVSSVTDDPTTVELAPTERRRQAIVCHTEEGVRAYLNECRHLPVPLDGFSGDVASSDGYLLCRTHGAKYRPTDGFCVEGPCQGESLVQLSIRRVASDYVIDDEP